MTRLYRLASVLGAAIGLSLVPVHAATTAVQLADLRARLPQDEVIYFLLPDRFDNADLRNDRGGLKGDRLITGYDPTAKGFYHGGDLKGVTRRLDYIQSLGVTALWLSPVFTNKAVQGPPGQESSGYHGYWITDFTRVDPHLGTNADFKTLVDAAHERGMKVYMDIIANHTADVIRYRECVWQKPCAYRSRADYPYQRKGGVGGATINAGFAGDGDASPANWAKLIDPSFAYTPFVPPAEAHAKAPAWLNDPIYYHNRGDSTFKGESSQMGDFSGLDDLATENPRVIQGMIEIYAKWIDDFDIDGFRVDTQQHVNPEFWAAFAPAMVSRAKARGIPNFAIFGENFTEEVDPAHTAVHTRVDKMPSVLDFPFARAIRDVAAGNAPTSELSRLFAGDSLYEGGAAAALTLPTFLGNHDMGRIGMFIGKDSPKADPAERMKRDLLAHAMLLTLRGVPTIYYGDEQGFTGDGGDQDARQDMFASKVAVYNDNVLLGTPTTTATAHFGSDNMLFVEIAKLARVRTSHPALTRGLQAIRFADEKSGLFAVSRFDPGDGHEIVLLFNTGASSIDANVEVAVGSTRFTALAGQCTPTAQAPGSIRVLLPAFGYAVCEAAR